jgi:hypothetical protein
MGTWVRETTIAMMMSTDATLKVKTKKMLSH